MNRFKKIAILDKIVLLEKHWQKLNELTESLIEFSGLNPTEILQKLHAEMDAEPQPMCWTALAQEEISVKELNKRIKGADAIITCWTAIPDEVIRANPQIKYIGFWTNLAGHRINFNLAKEKNIFVTIIPDYGTESVAELTIAGILAVSRKLIKTHNNTLRGEWPYELIKTGQYIPKVDEIPQRILNEKTIGIVGLGRIGKRVAEIALAFRMKVKYWSKNKHPKWEEKGLSYASLEELFEESDIVSIHLSPYAPPQIINKFLIGKMRDDSIFVNTSAGHLIDQEYLFVELQKKRIHAFLDVYKGLPPRKILKEMCANGNVFTYRSGWYTREAITYKGDYLLNNIQKYLTGVPQLAAWDLPKQDEDVIEKPCTGNNRK